MQADIEKCRVGERLRIRGTCCCALHHAALGGQQGVGLAGLIALRIVEGGHVYTRTAQGCAAADVDPVGAAIARNVGGVPGALGHVQVALDVQGAECRFTRRQRTARGYLRAPDLSVTRQHATCQYLGTVAVVASSVGVPDGAVDHQGAVAHAQQ